MVDGGGWLKKLRAAVEARDERRVAAAFYASAVFELDRFDSGSVTAAFIVAFEFGRAGHALSMPPDAGERFCYVLRRVHALGVQMGPRAEPGKPATYGGDGDKPN